MRFEKHFQFVGYVVEEVIMETSILTDDQKRQWTEDGYLLLKGVLSPHEVKNLAAAVDKMYAEHLKQPDAHPDNEDCLGISGSGKRGLISIRLQIRYN